MHHVPGYAIGIVEKKINQLTTYLPLSISIDDILFHVSVEHEYDGCIRWTFKTETMKMSESFGGGHPYPS